MKLLNQGTDSERIQVRCRIEGSFMGTKFTYEDPKENDGSQFIYVKENDPSYFWWTDGNFGCDCNRVKFLPPELKQLFINECGNLILIDRIIPLEGDDLPVLELNESEV